MESKSDILLTKERLRNVGLAIALGFIVVAGVLVYWSVVRGPEILAREDNPRLVEQALRIQRGRIFDTDNRVLAETIPGADELIRRYPIANIGPAIGYYSFRHGTAGIEEGYDDHLKGSGGDDWTGWWRNDVLHEEIVGRDIRLTIDAEWQQFADDLLGKNQGAVLLFSIPDGDIRAMVSHPGYDPNRIDESFEQLIVDEDAPLVNRVTQGQYQPGMIIQPFIMAQALGGGYIDLSKPVVGANDPVAVNNHELRCESEINESATWLDVLENRCPAPMANLAIGLGAERLAMYFEKLGFYQPPELPIITESGEHASIDQLELAGIGQESLALSPLQVGLALAALVGDGVLPKMQLVQAETTSEGGWEPVEIASGHTQAIPSSAAEAILRALPVNEGIAEHSALVLSGPEDSTNAWYLGLAPAGTPRYGVVVVVEDAGENQIAEKVGRDLIEFVVYGTG